MTEEKKNSGGAELTPEEIEKLKSMEGKLQSMLDKFKDREKQLVDYENKLKDKELDWERKRKDEEERWRRELLEREKEIEKREKELQMQKIFMEERELEEKEKILREIEEEISAKHEKLATMKKTIGMVREDDVKVLANMLKQNLEGVGKDEIVLLVSTPQSHNEVATGLTKMLTEDEGRNGVYITFNRPFEQLIRDFEANKIDLSKVIFIDCVSKMAGRFPGKKENAVFIDNPSSLEEIGMYSEKILARLPGSKFIVLDSISNLMIYNDENSAREFVHFIVNKLRLEKIGGFLLTVEKEDVDKVVGIIEPLVDKVIKL
ncbi:MAG: ATPase domain-containing protein [Candidatus Altiarchaeota archaeon]